MSASQDEIPPPPPPPPSSSQTPTQQTPHTVSTIKLPILKKGEYDIWAMKMEHYLAHTDYPIWEVIQNGNGPVSITTDTSGQIKVLPPRTAEEIVARERERKARTTLLMALPEDHLAKFHKMTDAKEMWDAIKSRFGGNDESKKMQKYILKQQFEGFSVSNTEGLHKGYDRYVVSFGFSSKRLCCRDGYAIDFDMLEWGLKWVGLGGETGAETWDGMGGFGAEMGAEMGGFGAEMGEFRGWIWVLKWGSKWVHLVAEMDVVLRNISCRETERFGGKSVVGRQRVAVQQWSNEVEVPIAKPIVAEPNPIAAKPNHNSVKETSFSVPPSLEVMLATSTSSSNAFSMYGLMHLSDTSQLINATRIIGMFTRHKRGGLATWGRVQNGRTEPHNSENYLHKINEDGDINEDLEVVMRPLKNTIIKGVHVGGVRVSWCTRRVYRAVCVEYSVVRDVGTVMVTSRPASRRHRSMVDKVGCVFETNIRWDLGKRVISCFAKDFPGTRPVRLKLIFSVISSTLVVPLIDDTLGRRPKRRQVPATVTSRLRCFMWLHKGSWSSRVLIRQIKSEVVYQVVVLLSLSELSLCESIAEAKRLDTGFHLLSKNDERNLKPGGHYFFTGNMSFLANRLSLVISELVSDVQSAFVSNRHILDGPFILNELLSWCKHKKSKALIFKIDFEKAFDSVRWDYLDVVLANFGFGLKWHSWIQGCLKSAMGHILVNGSPTSEFKFSKGLKQGLDEGLYALTCNEDVRCLAALVRRFKLIGIFIEHVLSYPRVPPQGVRATIEECEEYMGSHPSTIATKKNKSDELLCITFYVMELDREEGFGDVEGSNLDNFGLSHDESFGVDDLDLNVNLNLDLNVPHHATHEEVLVSEVPNDHVVEGYVDQQTKHGIGEESVGQGTYDEDDVLMYEESKIVEPDVEVHLFDGFDSETVCEDEVGYHRRKKLRKLRRDMENMMLNDIVGMKYSFYWGKDLVSMNKSFRVKAKVEREVKGDHTLEYAMLRDYVVELQSTNLNTTIKITDERNTDSCSPTSVSKPFGLDGAFMKGQFLGQVLAAVGLDSNNKIYPLTHALVEAEEFMVLVLTMLRW
ncbi:ribonuclease H-like domain-containing protein [Tanacetum coccineum]